MGRGTDPVERASDDTVDLYEVSTWEPRSILDRLMLLFYRGAVSAIRWLLIFVGLGILIALFALGGLGIVVEEPIVTALVILSVIPAFLLAAYVWYIDVTTGEPVSLLIVTFVLAIVFAGFAAVVNSTVGASLEAVVGATTGSSVLAGAVVFFLIVGPGEEIVKLLAVYLYAFRSDRFDAVIDGAVYGAAAGLGFATIENALFISRAAQSPLAGVAIGEAGGTAAARAIVGPGHVLYSAIAGYYLGLAKFNPDRQVPIVLKGLFVAAVFHALYNTGTMVVPGTLAAEVGFLGGLGAVVVYVVGFNLVVGAYLFRKLKRYRDAYSAVGAGEPTHLPVELTEFEPDDAVADRSVSDPPGPRTATDTAADRRTPVGPFSRPDVEPTDPSETDRRRPAQSEGRGRDGRFRGRQDFADTQTDRERSRGERSRPQRERDTKQ